MKKSIPARHLARHTTSFSSGIRLFWLCVEISLLTLSRRLTSPSLRNWILICNLLRRHIGDPCLNHFGRDEINVGRVSFFLFYKST